ncbi:MAG: hypothetical protein RL026_2509 [Pseudomonadota bacterium]
MCFRSCILVAALACPTVLPGQQTPVIGADGLEEVVVRAREPRYVAATQRDRIGRVWVPVLINRQGPFRLVLDTGATRTAITAPVVEALGMQDRLSKPVMLRGVTGSAPVPTLRADSIGVGDLFISPHTLPIVPDAFGGADGLLGTEGLRDKRIYIDFQHDFINISRSRSQAAPSGFITLGVQRRGFPLLLVDANVGGVRAVAIIDTGAQTSIGNGALRQAMERRLRADSGIPDQIYGATGHMQTGEGFFVPSIGIGSLRVSRARLTFGDMNIFGHWKLTHEPALLVGMDILGLLDTLIIDYRRREIMMRLRN